MRIRKVDLAKELNCSPGTVTKLIAKLGQKAGADGRLDREKFLSAIVAGSTGKGGGWDIERRGKADVRTRAEALLGLAVSGEKPQNPAPTGAARTFHDLQVKIVREIARPAAQIAFGRACRAIGCSPEQSWALACLFAFKAADIDGVTGEDVETIPEPAERDWVKAIGKFDRAATQQLYERAFEAQNS